MADLDTTPPLEAPAVIGEPTYPAFPLPGVPVVEPGEVVVMAKVIGEQQAQIDTLATANTQQTEANVRLTAAMCTLPCPANRWEGLPAEGWTGRPEDCPGAYLSTIGECLEYACCDCCRALVAGGGVPINESEPHDH